MKMTWKNLRQCKKYECGHLMRIQAGVETWTCPLCNTVNMSDVMKEGINKK